MTSREKLLRKPIYWFDHEQNEIFRQVTFYMESEGINKTELAKRLNVSKGYISQILNGNFNYTLKKLIDLSLAIGVVPKIKYTPLTDVIEADAEQNKHNDNYQSEFFDCKVVNMDDYNISSNTNTKHHKSDFKMETKPSELGKSEKLA
jgi:transcriptional regulator with XRE-family HTH domain